MIIKVFWKPDVEALAPELEKFICPLDGVFSTGEFDKEPFDYKTFDDLINNFMFEGKPLKDVIGEIEPH